MSSTFPHTTIVIIAASVACGFTVSAHAEFVEVAANTPLADPGTTLLASWGDYDNDGDPDALNSNYAPGPTGEPVSLCRNDGGDIFVNATHGALEDSVHGRGAMWADYDNDGDLDIYHCLMGDLGAFYEPNRLYRNDGGTFNDAAPGTPLAYTGPSWWPVRGDYDSDGDLDLIHHLLPQRFAKV